MSNWWTRRMPRVSLPAAGLAPEARAVGGIADRELGRLEDLVPVQVRDRDLGRRDQVQLVAGHDVHLVFLVGDLARTGGAGGIDDRGRPDLGEAVLPRMDIEEPADEPALERRPGALVHGESGTRDLRAARVVDDVEGLADLPMRLAGPGRSTLGSVGTDLALEWFDVGQDLAPGPDGDVGLLTADRHVGVGRIRGSGAAGRRARPRSRRAVRRAP